MTKKLFYYIIIIAFVLFFAIVIGFQVLNTSNKNQESPTPASSASITQTSNLEPQTNNDGSVTVTVVPRKSTSADTLEFEIIFETHSVELNEDLIKTAVLIADNKSYEPIAWNGDPAGGHHRKGILRFAPISPQSKSIILKIVRVGGIEERSFSWQI